MHDVAEEAAPVARDRQQAERQAEEQHQQQAHPEGRHGEADHAADANDVIDRPLAIARGKQGKRHGDHDGDQRAVDQQEDRGFQTLADDRRDRRLLDDGDAEVALQRIPDEAPELDRQRLVEAEAFVCGGDDLLRRPSVQHDADRIAGDELNGQEGEQRDAEHDEHHLGEAPDNVTEDEHGPFRSP